MIMDLEDVIGHLKELHDNKVLLALTPQESVQKQYVNLGVTEGIKMAIKKLEGMQRRENF